MAIVPKGDTRVKRVNLPILAVTSLERSVFFLTASENHSTEVGTPTQKIGEKCHQTYALFDHVEVSESARLS
jgi:hypothetical protein